MTKLILKGVWSRCSIHFSKQSADECYIHSSNMIVLCLCIKGIQGKGEGSVYGQLFHVACGQHIPPTSLTASLIYGENS